MWVSIFCTTCTFPSKTQKDFIALCIIRLIEILGSWDSSSFLSVFFCWKLVQFLLVSLHGFGIGYLTFGNMSSTVLHGFVTWLYAPAPCKFTLLYVFNVPFLGVKVDAVVYLVDAYDKERFAESKKELDALLSDESLATVPFLILGNKIDIPYAASEDELRYHMGLTGVTTGKGKVNLADSAVRPLEVFMCSIVRKMGYGDGFKWVSQYIK